MRQVEFNILVVQIALAAFFVHWFRKPLSRWITAKYERLRVAYEKVSQRRQKQAGSEDNLCSLRSSHATSASPPEHREGPRRAGPNAQAKVLEKLKVLSTQQLLEAVISSDSSSGAEDEHGVAPEPLEPDRCSPGGADEPAASSGSSKPLLSRSMEVSICADVRPGKVDQGILDAVALASSELNFDVWDVVSKKNGLKVSACLRWTGCNWEALGLALLRLEQQLLQVVYIGVVPTGRRQHIGRALVKSIRQVAKRNPTCVCIVAVLPRIHSVEATDFFEALGFKRSAGNQGDQACFRLDVRKLSKSQRKLLERPEVLTLSPGRLVVWEQLLAEVSRMLNAKYFRTSRNSANSGDRADKALNKLGSDARVIVIGDVHGCAHELVKLLDKCEYSPGNGDVVILLGDLVNKGPHSREVVRLAREKGLHAIAGNHEFIALQKLNSWKASGTIPEPDEHGSWEWLPLLTEADVDFIRKLPFTVRLPDHADLLLVHAGLVPGRPLEEQSLEDMVMLRNLVKAGSETKIYQAVHDVRAGEPWAAAWSSWVAGSPMSDSDMPKMVMFGHDAPRGFQRYPHAIGLDTNCCNGGSLSAMVLPAQLVQVPATGRLIETDSGARHWRANSTREQAGKG
ncbi:apaH [Symbiodinium necroappetens]|uniref:ApaH protein n=1 Tax=Symbiodinium necroappetens TaxID=1628268 RepID=A0A812JDJ3_9DINO|nr:apaH [Symbiodinium necroappetens]